MAVNIKVVNSGLVKHYVKILILIVVVQTILLCRLFISKQEYHIDEIYSYILSNSYDSDSFKNAEYMWNRWIGQSDFDEFVTVQPGEEFSYDKVYYNNTLDVHPPLYYWMLHTISSFFPNTFSKWFGLSLNLIFFILTQIFVYLAGKIVLEDYYKALIPVLFYGFSPIMADTFLFIRMYGLLAMLSVLFAFIQFLIIKNGLNKKNIVSAFFVTFAGAMTQYYFLVLAGIGTLLTCIYIIYDTRRVRRVFAYALSELLAVACFIIVYPFVFQQVFSGTNNVSREIIKASSDFSLWKHMFKELAEDLGGKLFAASNPGINILILAIILFAVLFLFRLIVKKDIISDKQFVVFVWLMVSVVGTMLAISLIGGEYVYLRYIYFLAPLIFLTLTLSIFTWFNQEEYKSQTLKKTGKVVLGVLIIVGIINAFSFYRNSKCEYLYVEKAQENKNLIKYENLNCFVIARRNSAVPTNNFTRLRIFKSVYMCSEEELLESGKLIQELEENKNCVVYIHTDTYWTEGYNKETVLSDLNAAMNAENHSIKNPRTIDEELGSYFLFQLDD